jgi:hypothetical protein
LFACRKCKLYRFEAAGNEWKERGLGVVKLLQHKENKKIRLLMRQEKTLKIRANHIGAGRGSSSRVSCTWFVCIAESSR